MKNSSALNWLVWTILLSGAIASALLAGFVGGGRNRHALGYVAWALMPYALLMMVMVSRSSRLHTSIAVALGWAIVLIAAIGPAFYIDIMFIHVDAQGAIAMLMVPLIQGGLILLVSVFGLVWQLRSKITGASSLRSGKRGLDKLPVTLLRAVLVAILAGYALISILRYSDTTTIAAARAMDAFIIQYCTENQRLPTSARLHERFPEQTASLGWFYFTDDSTYLKVQYPVKWRNSNAPGLPQTSEFTATVYSYLLEYQCENPG